MRHFGLKPRTPPAAVYFPLSLDAKARKSSVREPMMRASVLLITSSWSTRGWSFPGADQSRSSTGVLRRHVAEALMYRRTTFGAQDDFDRQTAHRSETPAF